MIGILDRSQSPTFSQDCQDRALPGTDVHLNFLCTEGAGDGVYSVGRWEARNASSQTVLFPLIRHSLHPRWPSVTQSAQCRKSYGKIGNCEQSVGIENDRNSKKGLGQPSLLFVYKNFCLFKQFQAWIAQTVIKKRQTQISMTRCWSSHIQAVVHHPRKEMFNQVDTERANARQMWSV